MGAAGGVHLIQEPESASGAPDSLFVPLSWRAESVLRARGLRVLPARDLLKPLCDEIGEQAWKMSESWFLDERGGDVTLFDGISLGRAYQVLAWISCVLPTVKYAALAGEALREAGGRPVLCDPAAPALLRSTVEAMTSGSARRGAGGAVIEEAMGPSMSWRPARPSFWRDVAADAVFSAATRAAAAARRRSAPRVLIEYYPTLHRLFERIASPEWSGRFRVETLGWPPKSLAPGYLSRGFATVRKRQAWLTAGERRRCSETLASWRAWKDGPAATGRFLFRRDDVWPVLGEALDGLLSAYVEEGAAAALRARRVLARAAYAAVVVPIDSMPVQRIWIEEARRRGVPTVSMMHGAGVPHRFIDEGFSADLAALEGPAIVRAFELAGRRPGSTLPGGGVFDRCGAVRPPAPSGLRDRVLVLSNPPVFHSPHSLPGDPERYLTTVLRVLRGLPVKPTVKLHPAESLEYHRKLLAEAGFADVPVVKDAPFRDVLAGHGVVIGTISTAMLEAMAQSRWVTGANFEGAPFPPPFDGSDGFPVCRSEAELRDWLGRALAPGAPPPDHAKVLANYAGPLDGKQSERFLEALSALCGGGRA